MFQNLFSISPFCFEVVAAVTGMAQTVAGLEYLNLPWLTSAVMLVRISLWEWSFPTWKWHILSWCWDWNNTTVGITPHTWRGQCWRSNLRHPNCLSRHTAVEWAQVPLDSIPLRFSLGSNTVLEIGFSCQVSVFSKPGASLQLYLFLEHWDFWRIHFSFCLLLNTISIMFEFDDLSPNDIRVYTFH